MVSAHSSSMLAIAEMLLTVEFLLMEKEDWLEACISIKVQD